ncbi:MAG: hypothetical protein SGPRY_001697, partial [Prymnesium sp.]
MDPSLTQRAELLLNAARSSRADAEVLISRLLSMRIDVNCTDVSGFTPLALAARTGNRSVVAILLQHEADPNLSSLRNKNSPLLWAAAGNHTSVVQLLLEAKALPDKPNINGDTALLWACRSGALEASTMLLKASPALLETSNQSLMTPLICACAGNHPSIANLIVHHEPMPSLEASDTNGRTALHFAAAGSAACVELLLAAGADWAKRDKDGNTPLVEAKRSGQREAEEMLLEAWQERERHERQGPENLAAEDRHSSKGKALPGSSKKVATVVQEKVEATSLGSPIYRSPDGERNSGRSPVPLSPSGKLIRGPRSINYGYIGSSLVNRMETRDASTSTSPQPQRAQPNLPPTPSQRFNGSFSEHAKPQAEEERMQRVKVSGSRNRSARVPSTTLRPCENPASLRSGGHDERPGEEPSSSRSAGSDSDAASASVVPAKSMQLEVPSIETSAWQQFSDQHPKVAELDIRLSHLLGQV